MAQEPSVKAVAQSYRDAADVLESGDFENDTCCGNPLTEYGTCQFRGHPTRAHSEILSYPESYDEEGHYIG
jgi:hypothetical protein